MKKYTYQVKKNGLMVKIYEYVYNEKAQFNNFCPFFWLTFLATLLIPFVSLWRKGIVPLVNFCFEWFIKLIEGIVFIMDKIFYLTYTEEKAVNDYYNWQQNNCSSAYDKYQQYIKLKYQFDDKYPNETDKELYEKYKLLVHQRSIARISEVTNLDKDYVEANYDEAYKQYNTILSERRLEKEKLEKELKEKKRLAAINRKNTLIKISKFLMWPFITILSIVGLYLIYWLSINAIWPILKLIGLFFYNYTFIILKHLLIYGGLTVLVIGGVRGLCFLLRYLYTKIDFCTPSYLSIPWLTPILNKIKSCLKIIGLGIIEFFIFLKDGFLSWKEDNCPSIDWVD